ncbi:hypothetical protein FB451DRAFT_1461162 [Mycena latifolia]|nr:hypothetical protein FB451DRAFT_1461162 [Mycena latifolia]
MGVSGDPSLFSSALVALRVWRGKGTDGEREDRLGVIGCGCAVWECRWMVGKGERALVWGNAGDRRGSTIRRWISLIPWRRQKRLVDYFKKWKLTTLGWGETLEKVLKAPGRNNRPEYIRQEERHTGATRKMTPMRLVGAVMVSKPLQSGHQNATCDAALLGCLKHPNLCPNLGPNLDPNLARSWGTKLFGAPSWMSDRGPEPDLTSNFDPNFMPQLRQRDLIQPLRFPTAKRDKL